MQHIQTPAAFSYRLRGTILAAIAAVTAVLGVTGQAQAGPVPWLNADAVAGACGGSVGCGLEDNQTISPATAADTATASETSTLLDGSSAYATSSVSFGGAKVYAKSQRTFFTGPPPSGDAGDAQSKGYAEFYDYFSPSVSTYSFTYSINGSHTPVDGLPAGINALATLNYVFKDVSLILI